MKSTNEGTSYEAPNMHDDLTASSSSLMSRRKFCCILAGALVGAGLLPPFLQALILETTPAEDLFAFMNRTTGKFDRTIYQQLIGAANDFKEGDQILGVAASDEAVRSKARRLLSNTRLHDILNHPLFEDKLYSRLLESLSMDSVKKISP
ncbi:MAG: ethanolamine ammonia-lyase subunit EutB, partial [Deltaproteobacteria bacterium]